MQRSHFDTRILLPDLQADVTDPLRKMLNHGAPRTRIFRALLAGLGKKGGRLVELGAGPCIFGKIARDEGYEVTAVDARTERKPPDDELGSIRFVQSDVRDFDLAGFDVIVFLGLLYHFDVDDQVLLLTECARTGVPVILETQIHVNDLVPSTTTARWARTIVSRGRYEGIMFPEQDNPMTSVGNMESFWPTEPSLLRMLEDAGFDDVVLVDPVFQSNYGARRFYLLNAQGAAKLEGTTPAEGRLRLSILINRGQFDEARTLFESLPAAPVGPTEWGYVIAVAQMRLHFGETEKAIATVIRLRDKALEFGDRACAALLRCADFLEVAGDAVESEKTRQWAFERLRDPALARSLLQQAIVTDRTDIARSISAHIEKQFSGDASLVEIAGRARHQIGDLDDAERMCREALLNDPNNADVLTRLGFILSRRDAREEAATVLERALALDPENPRILEKLVAISLRLKRPADAERFARRLTFHAPLDAGAHYSLARALKQTRRRDEALASAKRAADLDPGNEKYSAFVADLSKPKGKSQGTPAN